MALVEQLSAAFGRVGTDVKGILTSLGTKLDAGARGATNGVAALGADGKVPVAQLPPLDGAVSSVAGKTGAVTLGTGDVSGLGAALGAKANTTDVGNTATDFVAAYEAARNA